MGSPKKKKDQLLTHMVPVRFTEKEYRRLRHYSVELLQEDFVTTFIRNVVLSNVEKGMRNVDDHGDRSGDIGGSLRHGRGKA